MNIHTLLNDAMRTNSNAKSYANLRARKMGPFIALHFDLLLEPSLNVPEVARVQQDVRQHLLHANQAITEVAINVLPATAAMTADTAMPALAVA